MKIDPAIKPQDLSQHFQEHLGFITVTDVKASVFIAVLILYDLPLMIGLLSILKLEYLLLVSPLLIIIHLWGVRLLIKNPYSTQFEMILFMGVFGLLGSLTLYVIFLGFSYDVLAITSIYYYLFVTLSLGAVSFILVKYQVNKYSKAPSKEYGSQRFKYIGLAIVAPAIGYTLGQSAQDTLILKHFIAAAVLYFFIVFHAYIAAKFLHQFFFMKVNKDYVILQEPSKKEKKKLNNKEVVIK